MSSPLAGFGNVNTAGGSRVAIGSTNLGTTLATFEADSYIDVGEVEDAGQFGDESQAITFTALTDSRVRKFKGPRDAGTMAVVCGDDPNDAGQDALDAAEQTKFDFNIRVTLNDAVTLNGQPSVHYFHGKIMGQRRNVGNVSNVVKKTFNIAINSAIFETLPT